MIVRPFVPAALLALLCGCSSGLTPEVAPAPAAPTAEDLRAAAREVAEALRDRDFRALAERAHPERGVRFSPYAHVDPEVHTTLSADELRAIADGAALERLWGHHDGTGEPIRMTVRRYFDRFVYDAPYLAEGSVAVDARQGRGNTRDNAATVYPDGRIFEYHLPGRNPDYGGMDWRSLRLVFEPGERGRWHLVGVIHDEWTI